jgi:hypothetical protein
MDDQNVMNLSILALRPDSPDINKGMGSDTATIGLGSHNVYASRGRSTADQKVPRVSVNGLNSSSE